MVNASGGAKASQRAVSGSILPEFGLEGSSFLPY
jgi:hypothetical protein